MLSLRSWLDNQKKQIAALHDQLLPAARAVFPSLLPKAHFGRASVKWAMATIWARAVHVSLPPGQRTLAFVPAVDCINHAFDKPGSAVSTARPQILA